MVIRTPVISLLILITTLLLSACEEPAPPVEVSSRPVKTLVAGGSADLDTRSFPASVDAIKSADISFRVPGKLEKMEVREGDEVKQGQLLASLDPVDFNIALNDRKASFETAKANYDRAKQLVEQGAISRVDHDNIRAQFFTAEAALKEAEQNLEYTHLTANFDGYIAKRYVENFEQVLKSQTIFSLQDVSELKLVIDVPENLMILINRQRDTGDRKVIARFNNIPGVDFELDFLEVATKADPSSKTFRATFIMPNPPNHNVLPGMTATVIGEMFPEESTTDETVTLPVAAVISDTSKNPVVWVVDEKTMTVSPKPVTTGLMSGDSIQVKGLTKGERVVIAGAAFLRENMKVTLLETGEQP